MDYSALIDKKRARWAELEMVISEPGFFQDPRRAGELLQEHKRCAKLLDAWRELQSVSAQVGENEVLAASGDEDMALLASEELPGLRSRAAELQTSIQYALLPRDETEDRDALVEIRAGTGGDEASLFAGDLTRMYQRFAEERAGRSS